MKAARVVADLIERAGVRHVFGVPGESYLGLLDELAGRTAVRIVTARHESGAGFMAEGYAKATGRVGVCMASRGPGALNCAIALHQAMQDATPVVALIGQVGTDRRQRGAFQEIDVARVFGPMVKWAVEVDRADRAGELVARALSVAEAGRPGPAVVALPEDVADGELPEEAALPVSPVPAPPAPHPELVKQVIDWVAAAERPVVVAGRGVLRMGAAALLVELAESFALPVFSAWRRMDVFPNDHPHYAGTIGVANDPSVVQPLLDADLVMAVGTQWNEVTSLRYRTPRGRLVHVDADPQVLVEVPGRLPVRESLPVLADAGLFLQALLEESPRRAGQASGERLEQRQQFVRACRARYEACSTPRPCSERGFVHPEGVMAVLNEVLPAQAAIVSDAGNFATWYHRYYRFRIPCTHFAPVSGSMGYGLPAAIGVALGDRATGRWGAGGRPVVVMAGDGGFLMTASELATAVRLQLPVVILVFANGLYGTIYAHQLRRTDDPARLSLNRLANPDFAALARSFGACGETVNSNEQFEAAFRRALAAGRPALLELRVNPERLHALSA
ncbi:MAG: thiamine pyrophosphate-binding protein [Bacillota bacterium]